MRILCIMGKTATGCSGSQIKKEKRPNFRRKLRRGFKKILFRKENFKKKEKEKL